MDLDTLLEIGDKCIHDEPPACKAACPVHLDIRAFMNEIEKGDFHKAYKLMEKKLPFAGIIGMVCDHPCEKHCVRKGSGDALGISDLEKAVISYGYSSPRKNIPVPKEKGKVAVIGGGMSGLTAASDLDKKGFQVIIYERQDRLGGRIWNYESDELNREMILKQFQVIEQNGIQVKWNSNINQEELDEIAAEYDAVYLGTGEWENEIHFDTDTFQLGDSSIFAGGRLVVGDDSLILSVSSGRRAAVSIGRYIEKVSITALRAREDVFETKLKYKDKSGASVKTTATAKLYSREEAVREAGRCLKCECNECIRACSHMQSFRISPDAYVRQINQNERIILGTHYANSMINSCSLCGLCKEQCFLDISMKTVIQETRESMVEKKKMPPSAHDFALRDMQFSNSEKCTMVRAQKDCDKTKYIFYPGCQLSAAHPEYIPKLYRHLVEAAKKNDEGEGVGIYLGCCGAPADWAGRQDLSLTTADGIRRAWEENSKPVFILACSSCLAFFEKFLPEIKSESLWTVLDRCGLPEGHKKREGGLLAIHDACATRYHPDIHDSIRNIAAHLGWRLIEPEYTRTKTKCCGYGGLVSFSNREQAAAFVKDRINECKEDMLVYCAMCRDLFAGTGKRTYHILDLIFGVDKEEAALRKRTTLSDRQANRMRLKRSLLREIWEEEDMDLKQNDAFKLIIPESVIAVMEDRLILKEDVEQAIDNAQKNRERFFNRETANYLTRLRLGQITYWVRYEEKGDSILINSVYSHRMEVVEE